MADANAQSVRHQVYEREAAATGQEEEGHGKAQEVRQQQELILLTGQEAGAEATPPMQVRGGASRQQRQ